MHKHTKSSPNLNRSDRVRQDKMVNFVTFNPNQFLHRKPMILNWMIKLANHWYQNRTYDWHARDCACVFGIVKNETTPYTRQPHTRYTFEAMSIECWTLNVLNVEILYIVMLMRFTPHSPHIYTIYILISILWIPILIVYFVFICL